MVFVVIALSLTFIRTILRDHVDLVVFSKDKECLEGS